MYSTRQIERGRRLVGQLSKAKWDLGDLALEVMPTISNNDLDHKTSPEKSELEEFAVAIGLSYETLMRYRQVAAAFPKARRREELAWNVHREFAGRDDRIRLLHQRRHWSVDSAREYLGHQVGHGRSATAPSTISAGQGGFSGSESRRPTAQEIREAIKEDPRVVDEVLTEHEVRSAILTAEEKRHHEMAETRRMMADPPSELDKMQAAGLLRRHLYNAKRCLKDALEQLLENGPLAAEEQEVLLELVADLRTAVDMLGSAISTGDRSFEDQLADLLKG